MLVMETIENLATVKARLSEFVESAQRTHERIVITKNGRPAALLMSVEDYEGLLETLDLLSDPDALRRLRESEEAVEAGDVVPLVQVQADVEARRRATEPVDPGAGAGVSGGGVTPTDSTPAPR
jgi:antitoxin YefM